MVILNPVNVFVNRFWRHEIYCTNALLLLVWSICEVIFVAQKQSDDTFMETKSTVDVGNSAWPRRALHRQTNTPQLTPKLSTYRAAHNLPRTSPLITLNLSTHRAAHAGRPRLFTCRRVQPRSRPVRIGGGPIRIGGGGCARGRTAPQAAGQSLYKPHILRDYPRNQNVQRFRVGLVFKAHRLLYHSTLG